jgi:CHAT domain-containing protein/tetratricopeptide (TPR) repeat protein
VSWLARSILVLLPTISNGFSAVESMDATNRAWQLWGQERQEQAIALLQQVIDRDKTVVQAYTLLAEIFVEQGKFKQGEQYFRSLIQPDGNSALPFYGLAKVLTNSDPPRALISYANCIRSNSRELVCYEEIANALRSSGRLTPDEFHKLIRFDATNPRDYLAISQIYAMQSEQVKTQDAARRGLTLTASGDAELRIKLGFTLASSYSATHQNFDEGLGYLEAAARFYDALNDWPKKTQLAINIANFWLLRDPKRALALHRSILSFCQNIGHKSCQANETLSLGETYRLMGDLDAALSSLADAKKQFDALGNQPAVLDILTKMGSVYVEEGDLAEAYQIYDGALQLAVKSGRRLNEAYLRRSIGDLYEISGDYFKAIDLQRKSVRIFQELRLQHPAGAGIGNIGSIYASLGDNASALQNYRRSLYSARQHSDPGEEQNNLTRLGALYLKMGEPKAALPYLQRAIILADTANYIPFRALTLLTLGSTYRTLKEFDEAGSHLETALTLARQIQSAQTQAEALVELGWCGLDTHRLQIAETRFTEAFELAERTGSPEFVIGARSGLAEVYIRRRQWDQAFKSLSDAIDVIESLRARVPAPDLRATFVQDKAKAYENITYVLSLLHEQHPNHDYDRQAFLFSERGRARSFLDLLVESRAHVTKGLTPPQIKEQASLNRELARALSSLATDKTAKNEQGARDAEEKLARWSLDLRQGSSQYQQLQYPQPSQIPNVNTTLARESAVLLQYQLGERRSLLWVLDGQKTSMLVLPTKSTITHDVMAFHRLLANPPRAGYSEILVQWSRQLYDTLVKPAESLLTGADRLLIVPDGALYYVPFESLTSSDGKLILEKHTISYVPSASAYVNLAQEPRPSPSRSERKELLAYANPAIQGTSTQPAAAVVRSIYRGGGFHFGALPNAETEVQDIAHFYPPNLRKVLIGQDATESSVKNEKLTEYRYLHFATHAFLDEQIPTRSGIVLSQVNTGEEDGILRMNEIFNLELNADLVVLSACQTGLGKLIRGEGLVGLTRAFLYAGTPRVVVSLWEVNDVATAEFMKSFYKHMNEGAAPSLALRQAKLDMHRSGPPAYRHPYFWAPFTLVGLF